MARAEQQFTDEMEMMEWIPIGAEPTGDGIPYDQLVPQFDRAVPEGGFRAMPLMKQGQSEKGTAENSGLGLEMADWESSGKAEIMERRPARVPETTSIHASRAAAAALSSAAESDPFHFSLQGEEYRIFVAQDARARERSYRFMKEIYAEKGWGVPDGSGMHCSPYELLPDSVTLLVERGDEIVATMTAVVDSAMGLPDDENFPQELNGQRTNGRKLVEIISLGVRMDARGEMQVLIRLFNMAYLVARGVKGATDFVITVLPHHTAFYCRKMLFEKLGPSRYQKKTGVVVDLLRLDFEVAERETHWEHSGTGVRRGVTIYRHFRSAVEAPDVVRRLNREIAPIDVDCLLYFLAAKPVLLRKARRQHREYIFRYLAHHGRGEAWRELLVDCAGPDEGSMEAAGGVFDMERWKNAAVAV